MTFPLNFHLCCAIGAGLIALICLPLWRAWCQNTGLVDEPGQRKIHEQPVPLCGGLAILTGLLLAGIGVFIAMKSGWFGEPAASKVLYGSESQMKHLPALVGGAVGMTLLGWMDDKFELRPLFKFGGQLLVAGLIAAGGIRVALFVPGLFFSYVVTVLWILTVTNAFNFMDNMNGLSAGLAAIASSIAGIIAAKHGDHFAAGLGFLVCGAALGFLPFNFPRASAFLGDAGSHLLGCLLSLLTILPGLHSASVSWKTTALAPLLILAVPLLDLVWVVLLRWFTGKPFYIGDNNHLSHHLVRLGLSRAQAVMLLWILAAVIGSLALLA